MSGAKLRVHEGQWESDKKKGEENEPLELHLPVVKNGFGHDDEGWAVRVRVVGLVNVGVNPGEEGDGLKRLSSSHFVGKLRKEEKIRMAGVEEVKWRDLQ
jgi:hypothetical protein